MKRKWFVIPLLLLLSVGLLAGCGKNDPKEEDPMPAEALFTVEEYPAMDGSTANLPLMAQVMATTCGISLEEAQELTTCSKTPQSWRNLANGDVDILLVYEAADVTKEELAQIGTEMEITPIGSDALVFINNEGNPVTSLTTEQLQQIYSGQITNWQEVGGEDIEIVAYQRSEASGSQSLFKKLLMNNIEPMAAPTELAPAEMGELIDKLAEYNNTKNALGYSVYYYAEYMYQQPGLKFLAVDGVMPSDATIADGSYPFLNDFYVVIRADAAADSPERQLRDWLLTDEGKAALVTAGYIPTSSV